jgi:hypothetical protein
MYAVFLSYLLLTWLLLSNVVVSVLLDRCTRRLCA